MKATHYKFNWSTEEYDRHREITIGALSSNLALSKAKNQFTDLEVADRIALQGGKSGVYEVELSEDILVASGKPGQRLVQEME